MGKRLATMFACAFAAVLFVAPAPVRAAYVSPNELWVGGTNVIAGGYWTTNDDGSLMQSDSTNYNVYYDGGGNLWLNNANIVGQGTGHAATGIYAYYNEWVDTDIALTIHLSGDNSVSKGYPIYVSPWGGSASLTITGPGSLVASGSFGGNGGIFVSGDTSSLIINNGANVTVKCPNSSAVTIVADALGEGTLKVDDATFQAYGFVIDEPDNPYGICFSYSGNKNEIVENSRVLMLSGNSTVRTNYMQATYTNLVVNASTEGGIVFDGSVGTVYGDMTLQEDLSIGEGETLTIYQGASLTIPEGVSLINRGTVTGASGSVFNDGTIYNYKGDGATLPSGITGNGTIKNIPTYEFEYPDKLELQGSLGGGNYTSRGTLSLSDDSILGEDGRVVVYATNKGGIELQNENDPTCTIPLTVSALNGSSSGYFELENETRVLAVLDGGQGSTYELQAVAFGTDMENVPNGTYSGTITLYVGYTKDSAVQFGDAANVGLDTLEPYAVTVTLENTLGLSVANQPQSADVNEGEAASFSIVAEGGAAKTYQWQVSTDCGKSWDDIDGATDATYTTPATTMDMDGNQYRCVVTSGRVTIASDPATLTVNHVHKPAGEKDPADKSEPPIPATGDAAAFFSAAPALVGATAVAAGVVLRRRR